MAETKPSAMQQIIEALRELTDVAEQCDSWQSFPSTPLEKARAALSAARAMQEQQAGVTMENYRAMLAASPSAPPVAADERTSAAPEGLAAHAIEELCQLGYTVRDGQLIPPDNLHELARVAGWASPSGEHARPVAGDSVQQPVALRGTPEYDGAVAAWICEDDSKALGPKCCDQTVTQRCPGCPHATPIQQAAQPEAIAPQRAEGVRDDATPQKCPITGRPYFMTLDHPELGMVPTYGGPFDSYTIPHLEGEPTQPWHEREMVCHHYNHDAGTWDVGVLETVPLRIIHEDVLNELMEAAAPSNPEAQQAAKPVAAEESSIAPEPTYTGSLRDPDTWATYIAGIIDSYLSSENAVRERDSREAALAGIIRRRLGWLTAPEHVPDPGCKSCGGTGSVCVGHSGREDDGDAPIIEQCDCFWPVSAEGVKRALEEVARLEGEIRVLTCAPPSGERPSAPASEWCTHCGCGNDSAGYAHAALCQRFASPTATAPAGAEAPARVAPRRQGYYRTSGCETKDATDPCCICWHDIGTGPLAGREATATEWRDAPGEALEAAASTLTDERTAFEWAYRERYKVPVHAALTFPDVETAWMWWQARACLSGVAAPTGASELPPLPEPDGFALLTPNGSKLVPPHEAKGYKSAYPFFTAEQMQEYARAALSGIAAEPLTEERIEELWGQFMSAQGSGHVPDFVRSIEREHGIGSPSAKEDQRG